MDDELKVSDTFYLVAYARKSFDEPRNSYMRVMYR